METEKQKNKPGPVAGPETRKYNVLIEPDLGEWAKGRPGGLSELVRRLLREERAKTGGATDER